jgi:hypothetical protein
MAGFAASFRKTRRLLPLVLGVIVTMMTGAADAGPSLEWTVKGAYLFKLPPFVEWPNSAFAAPSNPFNLCIVGSDPFGELLERGAAGQRIADRPVVVLRLNSASPDEHCQMMYVAGDPQFVAQALAAVRGVPVLTITDSESDEAAKGIVNFVSRDDHVRFEIDRPAALRNQLEISSKLLSIAVSANPGGS